MNINTSRRNFLAHTAATSGALVVGFSFHAGALAAKAEKLAPPLSPPKAVAKDLVESFVAIHPDGTVTVHVGKVDLGTGTRTAHGCQPAWQAARIQRHSADCHLPSGLFATEPV